MTKCFKVRLQVSVLRTNGPLVSVKHGVIFLEANCFKYSLDRPIYNGTDKAHVYLWAGPFVMNGVKIFNFHEL